MFATYMEPAPKVPATSRGISDADLRASPDAALAYLNQLVRVEPGETLANCLRRLLVSWHPAADLPETARLGFRACLDQLCQHTDPKVRALSAMLGERVLGSTRRG